MSGTARSEALARRWFALQLPDPETFWIRYRPRSWQGSETVTLDLSRARLPASWSGGSELLDAGERLPPLDDAVYLPDVAEDLEISRMDLIEMLMARSVPLVVQGAPAQHRQLESSAESERCLAVLDTTSLLLRRLAGEEAPLPSRLVPGLVAVVPVVPGLVDRERFERLCTELLAAGCGSVRLMTPSLEAADRRMIAGWCERAEDYSALFHAPPPDPADLYEVATSAGLEIGLPRPIVAEPQSLRTSRSIAEVLIEAGELLVRRPHGAPASARCFRAARFVDRDEFDLERLAAEGNLGVLPWLEGEALAIVCELLEHGRSEVMERLRGAG